MYIGEIKCNPPEEIPKMQLGEQSKVLHQEINDMLSGSLRQTPTGSKTACKFTCMIIEPLGDGYLIISFLLAIQGSRKLQPSGFYAISTELHLGRA